MPAPRPPAGRRPTMKDVAEAAGVSKALVSLVFRGAAGPSEATRAHVMAVAGRLGYRANRTASLLARRRSRLLGVTMNVRSPFHAELVEDIQAVAEASGYDVVLSTVTRTHDERRAVDTLLDFRCEAVILLGPELPTEDLDRLADQLPLVVLGRRLASSAAVDVVRTSDAEGLARAVDHLVGLGHERIVHVSGAPGGIADDRARGYAEAMRRHGLAEHVAILPGGGGEDAGQLAAEYLLATDRRPTAVTAFNDSCAIGVLDALDRAGLAVPHEVSVVGYDDSAVARLRRIDLTSVSQGAADQARLAVELAVERLDGGRADPRERVLSPRLVVRGSTAPPPA